MKTYPKRPAVVTAAEKGSGRLVGVSTTMYTYLFITVQLQDLHLGFFFLYLIPNYCWSCVRHSHPVNVKQDFPQAERHLYANAPFLFDPVVVFYPFQYGLQLKTKASSFVDNGCL